MRMAGELLALANVSKSYRRGDKPLRVLVDVALTVRDREIVAVVGSRDEGKTTLLEIAAGLRRPDRGEVWLAGVELTRCSNRERAKLLGREVAWVHREGVALDCKMLEYIALSLVVGRGRGKREAEHLAMQALERVGAEGCAGLRWGDLSNWERVLVGFARGIVREPSLLIVDDVIDGFGMSKTREAGELLLSFVEDLGCSVLMSASDLEAALIAERVWCFDRGRLKLISDEARDDAEVIELYDGVRQRRGSGGSRQGA
jgi:predicted ABC-type transport system involved in lysophospholipase L1 biosynthesis ATPase subunit